MLDLCSFRTDVKYIVNNLAKSVVTEIINATQRFSPKHIEGNEEELDVLVEDLCTDAINTILKIVESATTVKRNTESESRIQKDVSSRIEKEVQNDVRLSQPAAGVNKNRASVRKDICKTLENERIWETYKCLDHEYALPFSMAPVSVTGQPEGPVAAGNKRRPNNRKKKAQQRTADHTEKSSRRPLECKRCTMLFPSTQQLEDHEKRAHLDCIICGLEFSGILKLREHNLKVHQLMPYSCDYCEKTFNYKTHRNLHVMTHTGEKTCHCDVCGKGYSCISTLRTHRVTHFEKSFVCDTCGKRFYHACHLNRHKHIHKAVKPYQCDMCGKGFTQAENLKTHRMIHTDERELCAICGKRYRCLRNHMINRHSYDLPTKELQLNKFAVTCELCDKKLPNPSQYKLHMMTHTGEKPYNCDICGRSFRMKETLRDHKYSHTGEKPYKCTVCGKTFHLNASYLRHRSIHTGEMPYNCKVCGKHFRLLSFLNAHQKTQGHLRQKISKLPSSSYCFAQVDSNVLLS